MKCILCGILTPFSHTLHDLQKKHIFCEKCVVIDLVNRFDIILSQNYQLWEQIQELQKTMNYICEYKRD